MEKLLSAFKQSTDLKAEEIFEQKTFERATIIEQHKTTPDIEFPVAHTHMTNLNIPETINGKPGDPLEKRLFDLHFTRERIWNSWMAIGFVPFSRKVLKHKRRYAIC